MEKLREWLSGKGFDLQVAKGEDDAVDLASRLVTINAQSTYQIRLSSLIHECGHVRIHLSRKRKPLERICGASLKEQALCTGRRDHRSRRCRISILQEEMDAWESGAQLAKMLGVRYTKQILEKDRTSALMTYVSFAACRMRMNREEMKVRQQLDSALQMYIGYVSSRAKARQKKQKVRQRD